MIRRNLILWVGIGCFWWLSFGNAWGADGLNTSANLDQGIQAHAVALDLATEYYQDSRLADYFQTASLLWSETMTRRSDLQKKLPMVDRELIRNFRTELTQAFAEEPNEPQVYLLAGQYQLYKGQYESALWNFQQAVTLKPNSITVKMVLADYYLSRWQPDRVIALLKGNSDPDSSLRLGEACLQANDYFSALGYLLKAESLYGEYSATRNKDIAKAFLAIGEIALAKQSIQAKPPTDLSNPVRMTLIDELEGWIAWSEGNETQAHDYWIQGKTYNPDYGMWDGLLEWIGPNIRPASQTPDYPAASKGNADLSSWLNIARGFTALQQKKTDPAYACFLAGIKADHRSLIGFLGAARSQFINKKYLAAANLCYQGLAVNPNFRPLVELKMEADAKSGKKDDAVKDRELLRTANAQSSISGKIAGILSQTPSGKPCLLLAGETENLWGVWVSADGTSWQYLPWWGGPLYLKKEAPQLWVLPCGKELSGEAFTVRENGDPMNAVREKPEFTIRNGFSLDFFSNTKVVAAFIGNDGLAGAYFSEDSPKNHLIPYSQAGRDSRELAVWYRASSRSIGAARFKITVPNQAKTFKYHLCPESPVTNSRKIKLQLSWDTDSALAEKMAVSEENDPAPAVWRSVVTNIPFILSAGDGVKQIVVTLADHDGNSAEIRTVLQLDTVLPQVVNLSVEQNNADQYMISWDSTKSCLAWIESLTWNGIWQETPVRVENEKFIAEIVPAQISYSRIILRDQAGNRNQLPVTLLNEQLKNQESQLFLINNGTEYVNSRNIVIKPLRDISAVWSISNDLKTWGPPMPETGGFHWRLNPGEGAKLVFIKIYNQDNPQTFRVWPFQVFVDTAPPNILNTIIKKSAEGYIVDAEFSEPVVLTKIANLTLNDSAYQIKKTFKITGNDIAANANQIIKIEVTDRAGNIFEFTPDLAAAVDSTGKE